MIRPAEQADVEAVVEMGCRFLRHHPMKLPERKESLKAILLALMRDGLVLVADIDGTIGGVILGSLNHSWFDLDRDQTLAVELGWWIDEPFRQTGVGIRLLRAFEAWAESVGADVVVLSDLVCDGEPTLGDLTERLGFELVERSHYKRIQRVEAWQ